LGKNFVCASRPDGKAKEASISRGRDNENKKA